MDEPPDLDTLARRYLDLWQDQVTAMAGDSALSAALGRLFETATAATPMAWMELWTRQAAQAGAVERGERLGEGGGGTRGGAKAGAAPAAAASEDRGRDLSRIERRLAALEARLGRIEAGLEPAGGPVRAAPARPRKRRS